MSETKHTPGPWRSDGGHHIYGPTPPPKMGSSSSGLPVPLALLVRPRGGDIAEQYANARLIAAAPELLEALKTVIESASPRKVEHPTMFYAWEEARAVIAKAEGGAVAAVELPKGEADGDTSTDSSSAADGLPAEHYQDVLRERLQVRDEERGQG